MATYDALVYQDSTYTYAVDGNNTNLCAPQLRSTNRDDIPANAACQSIGSGGGLVHCMPGAYNIAVASNPFITLKAGTIFEGEGENTVFNFSPANTALGRIRSMSVDNTIMRNFKITGKGMTWHYETNHCRIENVVVEDSDISVPSDFNIYIYNKNSSDIEYINCTARRGSGYGFNIANWDMLPPPASATGVRYINCRAIDCGRTARQNNWTVGFCIESRVQMSNTLGATLQEIGDQDSIRKHQQLRTVYYERM